MPGRYGGTYVHEYIAIHFANWIDPDFYYEFIDSYKEMQIALSDKASLAWVMERLSLNLDEMKGIIEVVKKNKLLE